MSKKKKISRKELLRQDDAFIQAANQSAEWLKENQTTITAVTVAVVIGILATWGGIVYSSEQNRAASARLIEAFAVYDAVVVDESSGDTADPAAIPPTFSGDEAKWTAAREAFGALADTVGGGLNEVVRFYEADLNQRLGAHDEAITGFGALAEELSATDSLYFLAVERLGYLQETQGKTAEAIATYQRLESKDGFYADYAGFHQARLHLAGGNEGEARRLLERIEADFPKSSILPDVKNRLDQIGRSADLASAEGKTGE